jgi:hypothetical protein
LLYAGVALGFLGALLGLAISVAALLGALLGRLTGGALSMGAAGVALVISLVALAGAVNMRRHWRAGALLDALCGGLGMLALPEYYLAPALTLLMPAAIYVAADILARRRAARQVVQAAIKAREDIAGQDEVNAADGAVDGMTGSEVDNAANGTYDDAISEMAVHASGQECDASNNADETAVHAVEARGEADVFEPSLIDTGKGERDRLYEVEAPKSEADECECDKSYEVESHASDADEREHDKPYEAESHASEVNERERDKPHEVESHASEADECEHDKPYEVELLSSDADEREHDKPYEVESHASDAHEREHDKPHEVEPSASESDDDGCDGSAYYNPPASGADNSKRANEHSPLAIESDESAHAEPGGASPPKRTGGISRGTRGRQKRGR